MYKKKEVITHMNKITLEELKNKFPQMLHQEPIVSKPSKESLKYDRLEIVRKRTEEFLKWLRKL